MRFKNARRCLTWLTVALLFLQPPELNQSTLPSLRIHPLNPQHQFYNLPTGNKKKMKMSQTRVGENLNSFNNNSFNSNISFHNTTLVSNVCNVNNFGSIADRAEILAWLSPLEPRIRHHDIRAQRVEQVGDWLLRTEEYRNWFNGIRGVEPNNSALFCYGYPGVGKTYIR